MMNHNDISYPEYTAPSVNSLITDIEEFRFLFTTYCSAAGLNINHFSVDEKALIDIFIKTDQRKLHYKTFHGVSNMDELKTVATLAYWFIKYKPIVHYNEDKNIHYVGSHNENFALYLIITVVYKYNSLTKKNFLLLQANCSTT